MTGIIIFVQFYPEIDICQSEKEGDVKEKEKAHKIAIDEDFGDHLLGDIRSLLLSCCFGYTCISRFGNNNNLLN